MFLPHPADESVDLVGGPERGLPSTSKVEDQPGVFANQAPEARRRKSELGDEVLARREKAFGPRRHFPAFRIARQRPGTGTAADLWKGGCPAPQVMQASQPNTPSGEASSGQKKVSGCVQAGALTE
jgi:hypothetical protein